jgi:hypothetical protein
MTTVRVLRDHTTVGVTTTPFYRCPIIKYTGTCISYIAFLVLYSYVALFGFRWEWSNPEIILYVWILILIIDEVRVI